MSCTSNNFVCYLQSLVHVETDLEQARYFFALTKLRSVSQPNPWVNSFSTETITRNLKWCLGSFHGCNRVWYPAYWKNCSKGRGLSNGISCGMWGVAVGEESQWISGEGVEVLEHRPKPRPPGAWNPAQVSLLWAGETLSISRSCSIWVSSWGTVPQFLLNLLCLFAMLAPLYVPPFLSLSTVQGKE